MSFHQAIISAFDAAGRPFTTTSFDGIVLDALSRAHSPSEDATSDDGARLEKLRHRLEEITLGLWSSVQSTEPLDLEDLNTLISFVDERASVARSSHEELVARLEVLLDLLEGTGAISEASKSEAQRRARDAEGASVDITNTFVRFYYELLAIRGAISAEAVGEPTSDIEALLSFTRS